MRLRFHRPIRWPRACSPVAGRRSRCLGLALGIALAALGKPALNQETGAYRPEPAGGGRWAILLSGISGDPELRAAYLEQAVTLRSLLIGSFGFSPDRVFLLFEDPALDPGLIQFKSTRENLALACRTVAEKAQREDLVLVFISGHGSYDRSVYKLNLVGPDPTADDLAAVIYSIPAGRFVIVNTTSCSGAGIQALAHPAAVVVTATKTGNEKNRTHMGGYFIQALRDPDADADKNGRISILEAFQYASRSIEQHYARDGHLQTEHPVLEDDGDGLAHPDPGPANGDGLIARITYLDSPAADPAGALMSAGERALRSEIELLQKQIEELKYSKSRMSEEEYDKRLEELLVKLAEKNAKLPRK